MWHDHPFSQGNNTTKRAVGVDVGGNKGGDRTNYGKGGGWQYRGHGIGVLHKTGGWVSNPLLTVKETCIPSLLYLILSFVLLMAIQTYTKTL